MTVEQFFREWISTRPNLKTSFHVAGIEAMAFAEAYHSARTEAEKPKLIDCIDIYLKENDFVKEKENPARTGFVKVYTRRQCHPFSSQLFLYAEPDKDYLFVSLDMYYEETTRIYSMFQGYRIESMEEFKFLMTRSSISPLYESLETSKPC